jgi:hypothetical protein
MFGWGLGIIRVPEFKKIDRDPLLGEKINFYLENEEKY